MKKTLLSLTLLFASLSLFAQKFDFESKEGGRNLTWKAYAGGIVNPLHNNPSKKEPNTSKTVIQLIAPSKTEGASPWALATTVIKPLKLTANNSIINIKVYKENISSVAIKFEGENGYEYEVQVPNTVINGWEESIFNFSSQVGQKINNLIVIPDFNSNRTSTTTSYFDDIVFGE